jgi:hypothetical protein
VHCPSETSAVAPPHTLALLVTPDARHLARQAQELRHLAPPALSRAIALRTSAAVARTHHPLSNANARAPSPPPRSARRELEPPDEVRGAAHRLVQRGPRLDPAGGRRRPRMAVLEQRLHQLPAARHASLSAAPACTMPFSTSSSSSAAAAAAAAAAAETAASPDSRCVAACSARRRAAGRARGNLPGVPAERGAGNGSNAAATASAQQPLPRRHHLPRAAALRQPRRPPRRANGPRGGGRGGGGPGREEGGGRAGAGVECGERPRCGRWCRLLAARAAGAPRRR